MAQMTFERIEKKYLLTPCQLNALWETLMQHMQVDEYGQHTICNIYYDTDDYRLIRTSLAKPKYKEKLRLRSYGTPAADGTAFVEIKKKYDGVVYKRRTALPLSCAARWLNEDAHPLADGQIIREIDYFKELYQPKPKVFLAYDRVALFGTAADSDGVRLTVDANIRWRTRELNLAAGDHGSPLSIQGLYLMEIKLPGVMPLWLAHALAALKIYPVSFSKYGCCYKEVLSRIPPQRLHSVNTTDRTMERKVRRSYVG